MRTIYLIAFTLLFALSGAVISVEKDGSKYISGKNYHTREPLTVQYFCHPNKSNPSDNKLECEITEVYVHEKVHPKRIKEETDNEMKNWSNGGIAALYSNKDERCTQLIPMINDLNGATKEAFIQINESTSILDETRVLISKYCIKGIEIDPSTLHRNISKIRNILASKQCVVVTKNYWRKNFIFVETNEKSTLVSEAIVDKKCGVKLIHTLKPSKDHLSWQYSYKQVIELENKNKNYCRRFKEFEEIFTPKKRSYGIDCRSIEFIYDF